MKKKALIFFIFIFCIFINKNILLASEKSIGISFKILDVDCSITALSIKFMDTGEFESRFGEMNSKANGFLALGIASTILAPGVALIMGLVAFVCAFTASGAIPYICAGFGSIILIFLILIPVGFGMFGYYSHYSKIYKNINNTMSYNSNRVNYDVTLFSLPIGVN
jgi:hypothetical protein